MRSPSICYHHRTSTPQFYQRHTILREPSANKLFHPKNACGCRPTFTRTPTRSRGCREHWKQGMQEKHRGRWKRKYRECWRERVRRDARGVRTVQCNECTNHTLRCNKCTGRTVHYNKCTEAAQYTVIDVQAALYSVKSVHAAHGRRCTSTRTPTPFATVSRRTSRRASRSSPSTRGPRPRPSSECF
jgi:hypothetical protein